MRIAAALAILWVGMLGAAGCEKGGGWRDPGPEAEFRSFLMHWFKDERKQAFEMIDPKDRERLTEPLEGLREQLDESELPKRAEMLVAGRVDNPYDIKSIDVTPQLESAPQSGDRVELQLAYQDGRSGAATMVWREDSWYVDLPESESGHESRSKSAENDRADAGPSGRDTRRADAGNRGTPDLTTGERQD